MAVTSVLFLGCMFLIKVAKESIGAAQSLVDKMNAQIIAESTVEAFKFLGATGAFGPNKLVSSFGDDIGMKNEFLLDGTVVEVGKNTRVQALDAAAKLNVWGCSPAQVAKMVEILTEDDSRGSEIQDCLFDWFDPDDLARLNGAESYYYQTEKGALFGPRNYHAPQCIDEFSLVKGLDDPRVWAKLRNRLILAPGVMPNLNTVDKITLRAVLGINEDTADSLLAVRKANDFLNIFDAGAAAGINVADLIDYCSVVSAGVINLTVETASGNARETVRLLASFKPTPEAPFVVLEATY